MIFTIYYCILSTLMDPTDETVYLERRAKLGKLKFLKPKIVILVSGLIHLIMIISAIRVGHMSQQQASIADNVGGIKN